jgi:hypothetical protein
MLLRDSLSHIALKLTKLLVRCTWKINSALCGIEHAPAAHKGREAATRRVPVLPALLGHSTIKFLSRPVLSGNLLDRLTGRKLSSSSLANQLVMHSLLCSITHRIHTAWRIPCVNRYEQYPWPPPWRPQRFPRVEMQKPGHFQGALIDGTILLLGTNLAK